VILTALHSPGSLRAPSDGPPKRSATLELVRALYPGAPHATLCLPFCKLKQDLARCHYLASTDGNRLSAVVAHTRSAIEFTWCRPGRAETLSNLIAQVEHRLPALAFLPVVETEAGDWTAPPGLQSRGRFFRGVLGEGRRGRRALPAGFEFAPFDPESDLGAAAELLGACEPRLAAHMGPGQLGRITRSDYYFADGWFFLRDRALGRRVGLAINGCCPEFGEGFVDWIQVLPAHRGRGLGTAMLSEALRRLEHARFVTVSGSLDDLRAGELFARCGFRQMRRWTILARPEGAPEPGAPSLGAGAGSPSRLRGAASAEG